MFLQDSQDRLVPEHHSVATFLNMFEFLLSHTVYAASELPNANKNVLCVRVGRNNSYVRL